MPFYEFYCVECHCIYTFLSRKIDTTSTPICPVCESDQLTREISNFSALRDMKVEKDFGGFSKSSDKSVTELMAGLNKEISQIDSSDPKQLAGVLKKLGEATGESLGPEMQTALEQMEKGGDFNQLQLEMDSILNKVESDREKEFSKRPKIDLSSPTLDTSVYDM
ncbi:MAG: hypothetical protein COA79_14945 [Planctomycetota bacterium]|nr:MAG: hypothetical protein COA79_14945 [Planctomycetota bacterium]